MPQMGVHRLRRQRCHQSVRHRLLFGDRRAISSRLAATAAWAAPSAALAGAPSAASARIPSCSDRNRSISSASRTCAAQLDGNVAGAALQRG